MGLPRREHATGRRSLHRARPRTRKEKEPAGLPNPRGTGLLVFTCLVVCFSDSIVSFWGEGIYSNTDPRDGRVQREAQRSQACRGRRVSPCWENRALRMVCLGDVQKFLSERRAVGAVLSWGDTRPGSRPLEKVHRPPPGGDLSPTPLRWEHRVTNIFSGLAFPSFGCLPRSGIAESRGNCSHGPVGGLPCVTPARHRCVAVVAGTAATPTGAKWRLRVPICVALMITGAEPLFLGRGPSCVSSVCCGMSARFT